MAQFVSVAKVSEIADNSSKCVDVNGRRIAIFNLDGEFFATDDTCTHAHASLSEGTVSGNEVVCPLHFATFNICTGECTGGPAFEDLQTYPVHVVDDDIQIEI